MSKARQIIEAAKLLEDTFYSITDIDGHRYDHADLVNPDDFFYDEDDRKSFWKRVYIISFPLSSFIVNADTESDALDTLIDYFEKTNKAYLFKHGEEPEDGDFYVGGSHGRMLNEEPTRIALASKERVKQIIDNHFDRTGK